MFNYIERLRQKPEGAKKRIAFLTALLFAGIIFVVWLSIVYPGFKTQQNREAEADAKTVGPTSAFTDTLGEGFSAIGEQFSNIKKAIGDFYSGVSGEATTTAE